MRGRGMFPHIYKMVDKEPMAAYEDDGYNVKIYDMNEYPELVSQMIKSRGQFTLWSTVDFKDFKLLAEKGFYNKLKPLFEKDATIVHARYFNDLNQVASKHRTAVTMFTPLVMVLVLGVSFFVPQDIRMILLVGALIAMIVTSMILQKRSNNVRLNLRNNALMQMQKLVGGEKKYDNLMKSQREYSDEYFDNLYAVDGNLENQETDLEKLEENTKIQDINPEKETEDKK